MTNEPHGGERAGLPFASAEEQFRLLMEEVTDYSIFFTDPENRLVTWNAGAERILGWTESEIVGRNARLIFTPEDREKGDPEREIGTAAAEGRAVNERWHVRKDGSRFWGSGIVTALRDEAGGELRGFCKVMRDLTERKRWENELQAALAKQSHVVDTLQTSLLMVPPPDIFPGITVKPLYESASDDALIGGDFFDVFAVADGQVALAVGDATGKGLEAATYTAEVKFALRAYLRESPSPADALRRMNSFLVEKERLDPMHLGGSYVALALSVVDTRAAEVCCAWAGIEPPFLVPVGGGEPVPLLECGGPLLGIDAGSEFHEQRVLLGPGDVLAMSTDGLTEARTRQDGKSRDFFGYDGLMRAVREEVERHPTSLGDAGVAVAQRAREFAGGTISDDVCLLLARRVGGHGLTA